MIKSLIPLTAALLLIAASPQSKANTINGTVYTNQAPFTGAPLGPADTSKPSATFTVTSINFDSGPAGPGYSILGFLNSHGGNGLAGFTSSTGVTGSETLDNTIFVFTGTVGLTAGVTYSLNHDDGIYLFLNGGPNVLEPTSGNPTSEETSSFSVATTGNYSFVLEYTEINGAPGVLEAPVAQLNAFPVNPVPEPSSLALLGTGLIGVVGVARRRFRS